MYNKAFLSKMLIVCGLTYPASCSSCDSSCDINANELVEWNTYLSGYEIWSNHVDHIATCARLCVRMTKCKSFNFELPKGVCDLNSAVLEGNPNGRLQRHRTVYSDIAKWPDTLDPECYNRPCEADEVCVPHQLSEFSGSRSCLKAWSKSEGSCPKSKGWMNYGSSCYVFRKGWRNWTDAANRCSEVKDAHLVQIDSEAEQSFLEWKLKELESESKGKPYWTHGNNLDKEDQYVWGYPVGSNITLSFWADNEPNNPGMERCVALHDDNGYRWVDAPCDSHFRFICEITKVGVDNYPN